MQVRIIRRAKVWHNPGDIVEVSPEDATFLCAVGSAEVFAGDGGKDKAAKPATKKAAKG